MGVQTARDETVEAVRVWNSPHSVDDSSRSQMCVCVCDTLVCEDAYAQVCMYLWRPDVVCVCVMNWCVGVCVHRCAYTYGGQKSGVCVCVCACL